MGFSTAGIETVAKASVGPMPDGMYPFIVNNFSEKTTAAGNTMYSLDAQCLTEGFDKRRIFVNFNVEYPANEAVAKRAQSDCKDFCAAVGQPDGFEEPEELVGKQFVARVYTGKGRDKEGNERQENKIGDFFPANTPVDTPAPAAAKPATVAPRAAAPVAAGKGPASWQKKAA